MRVVCLLPSATEIVFALGLGSSVVAVTDECDYPPEAAERPVVSRCVLAGRSLSSSEIDRVVSEAGRTGEPLYVIDEAMLDELAPDVILTQDLCPVCALPAHQVGEALEGSACRANVIALDPHSITDVLDSIELVGAALDASGSAGDLVASLRARIEEVRTKAAGLPRPRVLCLEWGDPPWGAGHWVPEMVEIAGGVPLLGEHRRDSCRLSWDEVAQAAPDVVVFMPCSFGLREAIGEGRRLFEHAEVMATPAAQAGRLYAVDAQSYFSRSGPRLVDGLELLGSVVHPEVFGAAPDSAVARLS